MATWIRFMTLNGNWTVAHKFVAGGGSACGQWVTPWASEIEEGKPPRGWRRCTRCGRAGR